MGKSSSKAEEIAHRQALLTEIKQGKSRPKILNCFLLAPKASWGLSISMSSFNCVFFQTQTGYWWAGLEPGGRGGEMERWSHGRKREWSMDWLSRWAVGKCKKNLFIAGIEQRQRYGILRCQLRPGGDLLSWEGDQVLKWLDIYNTALHSVRSLVAKSAKTKFVCSTDVPESQIRRSLFTSAFF